MDDNAREKAFQDHIIDQLAEAGWLIGELAHYDRERALYPEDLDWEKAIPLIERSYQES